MHRPTKQCLQTAIAVIVRPCVAHTKQFTRSHLPTRSTRQDSIPFGDSLGSARPRSGSCGSATLEHRIQPERRWRFGYAGFLIALRACSLPPVARGRPRRAVTAGSIAVVRGLVYLHRRVGHNRSLSPRGSLSFPYRHRGRMLGSSPRERTVRGAMSQRGDRAAGDDGREDPGGERRLGLQDRRTRGHPPGPMSECVARLRSRPTARMRTRSVRHQLSSTTLDPERPTSRPMRHQNKTGKEEDRGV